MSSLPASLVAIAPRTEDGWFELFRRVEKRVNEHKLSERELLAYLYAISCGMPHDIATNVMYFMPSNFEYTLGEENIELNPRYTQTFLGRKNSARTSFPDEFNYILEKVFDTMAALSIPVEKRIGSTDEEFRAEKAKVADDVADKLSQVANLRFMIGCFALLGLYRKIYRPVTSPSALGTYITPRDSRRVLYFPRWRRVLGELKRDFVIELKNKFNLQGDVTILEHIFRPDGDFILGALRPFYSNFLNVEEIETKGVLHSIGMPDIGPIIVSTGVPNLNYARLQHFLE